MERDLDALGLIASQPQRSARFGPIEAGPGLIHAKTTAAMNRLADGNFLFDFTKCADVVDYFSELAIQVTYQGRSRPIFAGSVISAEPTDDGVEINAVSGVSLVESLMPGMTTRGVSAPEMIYVIARASGLRDERLRISGLELLPRETFEVLTPIDGVGVDFAADMGGVRFLPRDYGIRAISALNVSDDMRSEFEAPAYALALMTSTRILDAEQRGLREIELALSWLTTQLRYGLASLPNGRFLSFDRQESLTQPTVRGLVFVRGLITTRQWLRRPRIAKQARVVSLNDTRRLLAENLPSLTLQDRQALLALGRATREPDPLAQVHALWEAIEFYCSGVSVEPLFTSEERRAISKGLPTCSRSQRKRLDDMINQLNNAPLIVRLRRALDEDHVPIVDGEIELLQRLRKLRNEVVHGRGSELPAIEDVEYGISIVARMLVYRVEQRRGGLPGSN